MPDYIDIPLTRGKFAKIDVADWSVVSQHRWRAIPHDRTFYAVTTTPRKDGHRNFYMHRFITNATDGISVDHWNGDGLDNRRHNLRFASPGQQSANQRRLHPRNRSDFKGVSLERRTGKWRARIFVRGKEIALGQFASKTDAAAAYDEAAKRFHGEFAGTNKHIVS